MVRWRDLVDRFHTQVRHRVRSPRFEQLILLRYAFALGFSRCN